MCLLCFPRERQAAVDAEFPKIVADVVDQSQIGMGRHRVEADQTADEIERRETHAIACAQRLGSCAVVGLPTMERNSRRVEGSVRKLPSMRLVTMLMPGLCTPRVV